MKAVFITGHGGNEVIEVGERPKPARGPGDVLVRVRAATLNRVDLYMRDSGAGITHRLPQIMGLDGAGIVEEVDASETWLSPGQCVVVHPGIACGRCEFCQRGESVLCTSIQYLGEHRDGTLAEYVSLPARNVFPMPESRRPMIYSISLRIQSVTEVRIGFQWSSRHALSARTRLFEPSPYDAIS